VETLRRALAIIALLAALPAVSAAAGGPSPAPVGGSSALPPGEEAANTALEHSPRHGEFVDVALPGSKTARCAPGWSTPSARTQRVSC
jgi:hypothetical protein